MALKKRVLIVDDEIETLETIQRMLNRLDFEVFVASKGADTLRLAKQHKPDIIVLDYYLGDMRGDEVKQELSEDEDTALIPTLFLTGMLTKEDESFLKTVHDRVHALAKPVTREELVQAINALLG